MNSIKGVKNPIVVICEWVRLLDVVSGENGGTVEEWKREQRVPHFFQNTFSLVRHFIHLCFTLTEQ